MMTEVRVPATSANMGAGFDTMGIALGIYNNISVCETENGLKIYNRNTSEYIPTNENNLIYKAVMRVFDEVGYSARGLRIVQDSSIPMTRGLGSSSACIVGGLLSANAISGHKLPYEKLLELAVEMEGHPDNVTPALYGGFCTSVFDILWKRRSAFLCDRPDGSSARRQTDTTRRFQRNLGSGCFFSGQAKRLTRTDDGCNPLRRHPTAPDRY